MEKGTYRMRAPSNRPPVEPLRLQPLTRKSDTKLTDSRFLMLALLVLLAFACISCFSAAYYLFATGWVAAVHSEPLAANANIKDVASEGEKFLAYLPHSGFHNQRIAFENALVLSRLINRTLITPPIRLGSQPLHYAKFDTLRHSLGLSGKEGLYHCAHLPRHISLPVECLNYHEYTLLSWEWLVNMTNIKTRQRLVYRWNMTEAWFQELGISKTDMWTLKDLEPYQFRFLDTLSDMSPSTHKFKKDVYIPELAQVPQRLIYLGTLFGTSRLRLKNSSSVAIRLGIRESMTFANSVLEGVVSAIHGRLTANHTGDYLGVHLRLGDGQFRSHSAENSKKVWRRLLHDVFSFADEEIAELESQSPISANSSRTSGLHCRGNLYTLPHQTVLNSPLYISTDTQEPMDEPSLQLFLQTFPCAFFLRDFIDETRALDWIKNDYDGVSLGPLLMPFIDAMVVSRAWRVVGTEDSTFSRYVEDVLWPTYHKMNIRMRG